MTEKRARGLLVAGVGRSGTSIATRLAATLGLRLPRVDDIVPANWGNPDGYWESASLMSFNDELLERLGGDYWRPPAAVGTRELSLLAHALGPAARAFASSFGSEDGWLWKDPRLTVLLPFWNLVTGRAAVLVPYREPQAVARSLMARDGLTFAQGLAVWEQHTRLLLASLADHAVMLVRYSQLVADPDGWLTRLAGFCAAVGLDACPGKKRVDHLVRPPGGAADGVITSEQRSLVGMLHELDGVSLRFPAVSIPPLDEQCTAQLASIAPPRWTVDAG